MSTFPSSLARRDSVSHLRWQRHGLRYRLGWAGQGKLDTADLADECRADELDHSEEYGLDGIRHVALPAGQELLEAVLDQTADGSGGNSTGECERRQRSADEADNRSDHGASGPRDHVLPQKLL